MTIQKYLSNKTITGIVHCILVQIGHKIALDVLVIQYWHRCADTRSKPFNPPNLFSFYKILPIITYLPVRNQFLLWNFLNYGKIPKIKDCMAFLKFHICVHWCTILSQF